jgi:hypothetical protein
MLSANIMISDNRFSDEIISDYKMLSPFFLNFHTLVFFSIDSSNEVQPSGERKKRRKKQLSKHDLARGQRDLARGQRDLAKAKLPRLARREVKEPAPTCRTFFETSCTTKYVEQSPGKFAGDTTCEKIPVELCGTGKNN